MQIQDIEMLACVDCGADLRLVKAQHQDDVIRNGLVVCTSCSRHYPIIDYVGVFFRKEILRDYLSEVEATKIRELGYGQALEGGSSQDADHKKQVAAKENWEYQWLDVQPIGKEDLEKDDLFGSRLFWTFIPIEPAQITGKIVFVGCTGRGRETYHISKLNPKKILVNEIGSEIYTIANLIPDSGRKLVLLRSDLSYVPIKKRMCDVAICDHALQHVLDHKRAFSKLVEVTKPTGLVSICVYSWENNFIMTHLIEPLKAVMHLMPIRLIRFVSFFPALIVYLLIHGFYMPLSKINIRLAKAIPLFEHMAFWSRNSFETVWASCFDLMHAPISYHFRGDEVKDLAISHQLDPIRLVNTHGTMWSLVAKVQ